jgi:EmrB/QacA subfamily drug resistance transporter
MSTETSPKVAAGAGKPDAPRGGAPSWAALAVVMVGAFISVLDYFIANVAIPAIQADLAATAAQSQLVIIGYGVAFTAGMVTGGRLGDIHGRRRMFALGLAAFTVASAACGLVPNAELLIAARIVQGAAAAVMVPQVLGILGTVYTGPSRVRAFTVYGIVVGLAGVFGQLIGGVLITADIAGLDWRTIFLLNVPIGLVALAFVRRSVPESHGAPGARLDLLGALLVTGMLGVLVYALVEGREQGWPVWSWAAIAVSALLAVLAAAHLNRRARAGRGPLIDPDLLRRRGFALGLTALVTYFIAMGAFFFVLALYLQQGRGLSALQSGLVFLALGGGYFASSLVSIRLAPKLGRRLVAAGPLVLALGFVLVGLTALRSGLDASVWWLVPMLLVAGAGMGMTTGPLTNLALTGAPAEHAASASGAVNTAQEGGAAIGVAVAGTVFFPVLHTATAGSAYPNAFGLTLIPLVVSCLLTVALVWLVPHPEPAEKE